MYNRILAALRWAYLLRVQISIGIVMFALPPLSLIDAAPLSTLF